ncbi:methylenetetrahydrofolate reductase C-terminal domain-containing protein [Pyrococcus sp. ST04]|uniref:methylenetetrahydrofolate reductase C-terminal domain-containing protein n=1 Tax=Pyrococcus sp. ST04 TaxID=1183377 RepID=UPI0002605D96|nr:methylenetetrahydrofolate reductase C-terminal domain-containing protein [Pyrococcus sp. ST04]AFK22485.1 5,10-methylenetetrahydrofolate reductase [Pyrococcus sp. ST04]
MRVPGCPKDLLNGPCGGALNGICEVDGRRCPWFSVMERFELLDGAPLLVEHPIIIEMERKYEGDVKIRRSKFISNLEKGKALAVEFPLRVFEKGIREFKEVGDIYTVPDNPLGYPHISPTALATWLKIRGFSVMPHLTAKDRNAVAIASEFRTAIEFGFEGVLITTGDWPGFMIQSKPVFDLDSANMIKMARLMFSGILPTGERISIDERPFIAGTMNPNYPEKVEGKRLARKIIAGVDLVFTQVVASIKAVNRIPKIMEEAKKFSTREVPVVVSILYPMTKELEGTLKKMGIETGNTFEEIIQEISSLELGGVNLIVFNDSNWDSLLEEAIEILKEVIL